MSGQELAYVALAVRDLASVSTILQDDLGLPRQDADLVGKLVPTFGIGRTALALFEVGDPFLGAGGDESGLHHIALTAEDPATAVTTAGLSPIERHLASGLNRGAQAIADPATTNGVRVRFCTAPGLAAGASDWIERIDHLGVASADVRADEAVFCDRLGCPVESRQTDMEVRQAIESFTSDKYGVIYHSRAPEPIGGLRVLFATLGDCELEFLQNFDPNQSAEVEHGTVGNTKQDQGAIGRYVAKRGPGLHHLALKTPDIDALLARLTGMGRRTIDQAGRPGSRRARIGFVHPAALGGVLLHFVERQEI